MKSRAYITIMVIAALVAVSCSKNVQRGRGYATITLDGVESAVADVTKANVSDFCQLPAVAQFNLTITDNESNGVVYNGRITDLDQDEPYFTGLYTVTATYGTEGEEGPGKAFFSATTDFAVKSEQTTQVNMKAVLANTILKIDITDSFSKYYSNTSISVTTGADNTFSVADGSVLFVDAFRFCVSGSMVTPQGKDVTFEKWFEEGISPKTCYTVKIDASNVGSESITITFNDEVTTVDLGEITIND